MSDQEHDVNALQKRIQENEKILLELEQTILKQFEMGSLNINEAELQLRSENSELRRLIKKIENPPANAK